MKKILIFGCSHSKGSNEKSDTNEETFNIKSKGWYHYVDYFKDYEITVFATGGQGYWAWYHILLMLQDTGKLKNYTEIWIQETFEPRPSLLNMKSVENMHFFEADGIKKYIVDEVHMARLDQPSHNSEKVWPELKKYITPYNFYKNIIQLIAQDMQELCTKMNISGYVWSMELNIMKCKEFKRLPLESIYEKLSVPLKNKDNLLTLVDPFRWEGVDRPGHFGHQTEAGNKYIGNLINKAICQ
jgi:hypothetical protein